MKLVPGFGHQCTDTPHLGTCNTTWLIGRNKRANDGLVLPDANTQQSKMPLFTPGLHTMVKSWLAESAERDNQRDIAGFLLLRKCKLSECLPMFHCNRLTMSKCTCKISGKGALANKGYHRN